VHSPNRHSLYPKDGFPRRAPPPVKVEAASEETCMVFSKRLHEVEVVANEEGTIYRDSRAVGASHIHNPERKDNVSAGLKISIRVVNL